MSDIRVSCAKCSQKYDLPDDTDAGDINCLRCGAPLTLNGQSPVSRSSVGKDKDGGGLSFANRNSDDMPNRGEEIREVLLEVTSVDRVMAASRGAQKVESPAMLAVPSLLVVAGAMVLFQYRFDAWSVSSVHYEFGRNILLVGAWLLLVLEACRASMDKGALSLFFPPYVMLYALRETKSGLLRGAFSGLLIGLCTEAFLIPDAAILQALGPAAQGMVDQVGSWIEFASIESFGSEVR